MTATSMTHTACWHVRVVGMSDHSSNMSVRGSNTRAALTKACSCRADRTHAAALGSSRQTIIYSIRLYSTLLYYNMLDYTI
eukprot:6963557-Heterocapsa_arctica.AAC.1